MESKDQLFVGNLPYTTTTEELQEWIEGHGYRVEQVRIINDRDSGRSKGFGFITFAPDVDIDKALPDLDGRMLDGRAVKVSPALKDRPRTKARS